MALTIIDSVNKDRFDHYFTQHKALLYDIDENKGLFSFYEAVRKCKSFGAQTIPIVWSEHGFFIQGYCRCSSSRTMSRAASS
jgi:hypothetical protein